MKRFSNLYDLIVQRENIELAYKKARDGKGWQRKVKKIDAQKDKYLDKLQDILVQEKYFTSPYRNKYVYEPKKRLIWILPFWPDRIVHHAIANICMPIWTSTLIQDTYSCIEGRGQHLGSSRCMEFTKAYPYVLQCDISKFYPSIDHEILKGMIREKIKDYRLLAVLDEIIDSAPGCPIGNLLSQTFGNMYLNPLDHMIKQDFHIHGYLRYCDDFLLFGTKERLKEMQEPVKEWVAAHNLRLSKMSLFPTACGIDFLGYRHFPSGKILVRKRTAQRMKRKIKKVLPRLEAGKIDVVQAMSIVGSIRGWIKHANSHNLQMAMAIDEIDRQVRKFA